MHLVMHKTINNEKGEIMWQRIKTACSFFALLFLVFGCTEKKEDTYLRFAVEGKQYQVNNIKLKDPKIPQHPNYHRFMIEQNMENSSYQKTPNGHIDWIMESNSIEELQGKEIDFSKIQSEAKAAQFAEPSTGFTLDKEEITVGKCVPTGDKEMIDDMVIKIDRLDENYIEGSFSAPNYCYLSVPDKIVRPVSIAGSFRAKLNPLEIKK